MNTKNPYKKKGGLYIHNRPFQLFTSYIRPPKIESYLTIYALVFLIDFAFFQSYP